MIIKEAKNICNCKLRNKVYYKESEERIRELKY